MSPTVFRYKKYRFFFFSREEKRIHIHVEYPGEGDAKFWLTPKVELAKNNGLDTRKINEAKKVIEERKDEIEKAWKKHFGN